MDHTAVTFDDVVYDGSNNHFHIVESCVRKQTVKTPARGIDLGQSGPFGVDESKKRRK